LRMPCQRNQRCLSRYVAVLKRIPSFCRPNAHDVLISFALQDKTTRGRLLVVQNSLSLPRRDFPQQLKIAYRLCNDVADQEVRKDEIPM
jgi:hypothetical protein